MSRGGLKIQRADGDYEVEHGSVAPSWLENLAYNNAPKDSTAVEVRREPSLIEQMNAIMGNPSRNSRYNSVEDAVRDYQERTGLLEYQRVLMAQEIVDAGLVAEAEGNQVLLQKYEAVVTQTPEQAQRGEINVVSKTPIGRPYAGDDRVNYSPVDAEALKEMFQTQTVNEYLDQEGVKHAVIHYVEPVGSVSTASTKKKTLDLVEAKSAEPPEPEELPQLLQQFPDIETFVHNVIETQRGVQLPAILHSVVELFGRRGIRESDVYDRDFCKYVNKMLKSRIREINEVSDSGLGRGVGTERSMWEANDANRDPFINLIPRRMY